MGLGMSGAKLFVVKMQAEGNELDLRIQYGYMRELGTQVCPEVFHPMPRDWSPGQFGFAMELCTTPTYNMPDDLIADLADLLLAHVWSRDALLEDSWRFSMATWLREHAPWLETSLMALYPSPVRDGGCYIHGDPTIANSLWRAGHGLVVTDPLRWGGKIPPLREVDQGKMLQSCRGYESKLMSAGYALWSEEIVFLHIPPDWIVTEKSWFWSNVHLARAVPYLLRAGQDAPAAWALRESRRPIPCG